VVANNTHNSPAFESAAATGIERAAVFERVVIRGQHWQPRMQDNQSSLYASACRATPDYSRRADGLLRPERGDGRESAKAGVTSSITQR